MTLQKAIEIANQYQLWRKGFIDDCPDVKDISAALDIVIKTASSVLLEAQND